MNSLPLQSGHDRGRPSIKSLSKSRVAAGLQCHKLLYLECYHRDDREPADAARKALFESGREVGRVARGRWPGGVAVAAERIPHEEAVAATRIAMGASRVPAIYEAAFAHDEIRVRVDVLARNGHDDWDLVEVKSGGSVKEDHITDLAVQLMVAEGAGARIDRAGVLYVNKQYIWNGGAYDLGELFCFQDLTRDARGLLPGLREAIRAMREPLWALEPPAIPVGAHCERPYRCPFHGTCHANPPEHPVGSLPRLMPHQRRALAGEGIEDIRDIPDGFDGLSPLQYRVRDALRRGVPFVDPPLRERLADVRFPIHFLDFETCNPALPIIPGTRPFQSIPFQWSIHTLPESGDARHREHLHPDRSDPREPLARALLETLGEEGTIVVYSDFEARVIRELAGSLPPLREPLLGTLARMLDLHDVIQTHYYHPDFHGSFSIKQVLPVLVPGLSYRDLEIREGSQAAHAFVEMTDPQAPPEIRERRRDALLAYCRLDTQAMVRLYQTLKEIE